jgi:transcriptional regulator with XRE-family HTH domain
MQKDRLPLANNIKILRKRAGLNQEQLADKLNIKRSNVAAYETKNVEPRLSIILEIARLFDISISTLLEENLTTESTFPPFETAETASDATFEKNVIDINKTDVNSFITKSINIKKVLEGFKSFYNFRKSKLKEKTPHNQKIIFDIENFIQLMEDLIAHNEAMISMLSSIKR